MLDRSKLIGIGRSCEVYAWAEGQVIKLLMEQAPPHWADIEARRGRDAHRAGLPVPYFGEVVDIDGRRGVIMEHVTGPSMLEILGKQPWRVVSLARLLAKLQTELHGCPAPADWLDQRTWLAGDIENNAHLPEDLKQAVLRVLAGLPEEQQVCHGDFHPGNILLTARGPVIIDWLAATRGAPLGDMARSVVVLSIGQPPPGTPGRWLIDVIRKVLLNTYRTAYAARAPYEPEHFRAWQAVNAAAFLKHSVPDERPTLFKMIHQGLAAT